MGAVETSLCYGPVYFNVYPNLTLSLSDRTIGHACNFTLLNIINNEGKGSQSKRAPTSPPKAKRKYKKNCVFLTTIQSL